MSVPGQPIERTSWMRAQIGLTGALLLVVWVVLVAVMLALWPERISDVPSSAGTVCDVAAVNPVAPGASAAPHAVAPKPVAEPVAESTSLPARRIAAVTAEAFADPWSRCATLFKWTFPMSFEVRLLAIVATAAAIGSFVHIATSFAKFIGTGTFDARWLWWYTLRIPIGAALALVVYFAIRGGLLTASSLGSADINPFGIAALSGLVGLFSRQATDKLEETFNTLFRTAVDTASAHGDRQPAPSTAAGDATPESPAPASAEREPASVPPSA